MVLQPWITDWYFCNLSSPRITKYYPPHALEDVKVQEENFSDGTNFVLYSNQPNKTRDSLKIASLEVAGWAKPLNNLSW